MLCRMPVLNIPSDVIKELEKSPSGKMAGTQGPGVASYVASGSDVRVDVYVGLKLDGLKLYENISCCFSDIKMQFALKPVVICPADVLNFNSDYSTTIVIQVV